MYTAIHRSEHVYVSTPYQLMVNVRCAVRDPLPDSIIHTLLYLRVQQNYSKVSYCRGRGKTPAITSSNERKKKGLLLGPLPGKSSSALKRERTAA